ncbi:MAG: glycosyltransferase family 2 protein [Anaerolineae bacterium]
MPDLAVVIVSYNTCQLLEACLESLFASLERSSASRQTHHVCVVDNASTDDSVPMLRQRFPKVHLVVNPENRGFAAANNSALKKLGFGLSRKRTDSDAVPRYVLFLNPDTEVRGEAIDTMVRFLDSNSQVGVAGAKLLFPDGRWQHSAFAFPTLAQTFFDFFPINHRLINSRLNGRYPASSYSGEPFAVDHPLGAAFMVRGEVIEQVGLLDERFFIYCEEIDWCWRIKEAGWDICCVPQAEVIHHVAASTSQFRDEMFVQLWRSRYRLFAKHYSRTYQTAVRLILRLGLLKEMAKLQGQYLLGKLDQKEFESKLRSYQEVFRM